MKKILLILCLLSNIANSKIPCEEAQGIKWTGRDGTTQYCISKQTMNWWSAWAWCESINGKLPDLREECKKYNPGYEAYQPNGRGECLQINGSGLQMYTYGWAKNFASAGKPFRIDIGTTEISVAAQTTDRIYTRALCVINQ